MKLKKDKIFYKNLTIGLFTAIISFVIAFVFIIPKLNPEKVESVVMKNQASNVYTITNKSDTESEKLIQTIQSKYKRLEVILIANGCKRCQAHKEQLQQVVKDKSSNKDTAILIVESPRSKNKRIKKWLTLPETYHYPTVITYLLDGSVKNNEYYQVEPLYQNRASYYNPSFKNQ